MRSGIIYDILSPEQISFIPNGDSYEIDPGIPV